jgi:hypothetical protein
MVDKNNYQLRTRIIKRAKVFGDSSAGITRSSELMSIHALLDFDRGVIKL